MKNLFLFITVTLFCNFLTAQQKAEAEKLINEGITYHDKGDFVTAITKYDKALELDADNLLALAEKAYSLISMQKYNETIECCKRAIEKHPGESDLKLVYVTYGNALDGLKKPGESIEMYNTGIAVFPDYYQLHFNKGITLSGMDKNDEALACFQKSATLNPKHASSHHAIAVLESNKITSIMAYCRYLSLDAQSNRAKSNLERLQNKMKENVKQTGEKSVTINISPDMLANSEKNGENNFATADLILTMAGALDYDKKYKKETEVERFKRKLEAICSALDESQEKSSGFYWKYYAPYFVEMNKNQLIETFAYLAFSSSNEAYVAKWLNSHKTEIEKFFEWSGNFEWKTN